MSRLIGSVLVAGMFLLVSCSEQEKLTFKDAVIKERTELGGADGVTFIDTVENEDDGVAFVISYKENEENETPPSLYYYEKVDSKWERVKGTSCEGQYAVLGGKGPALYCGVIPDDYGYDKIVINDEQPEIFTYNENERGWYLLTDDWEYPIKAVAENGSQQTLNP